MTLLIPAEDVGYISSEGCGVTITHLFQLQHRREVSATAIGAREIGLGYQLSVIKLKSGSTQLSTSTFGLDNGQLRNSFDGVADVDHLDAIQHAIWDTQRCVIPVTGFRSADRGLSANTQWGNGGRVSFIPALRYCVGREEGRHGECQLLVHSRGRGESLPFALGPTTLLQWLQLTGKDAMSALDQPWSPQ